MREIFIPGSCWPSSTAPQPGLQLVFRARSSFKTLNAITASTMHAQYRGAGKGAVLCHVPFARCWILVALEACEVVMDEGSQRAAWIKRTTVQAVDFGPHMLCLSPLVCGSCNSGDNSE